METFHLPGRLIGARAWRFDIESRKAVKAHKLTPDDEEKLLHTANETWSFNRRDGDSTGISLREDWLIRLKQDVAPGSPSVTDVALWRKRPDLRDADTIAREFLDYVQRHAERDDWNNLEGHAARARHAVLDGTPLGYRRKVLERILDQEEERLREGGAPDEQVSALEMARDERREDAWRILSGRAQRNR